MRTDSLKVKIEQIILRTQNNEQVEEPKIELKREWYDFGHLEDKKAVESEFLKGIVALANTPGTQGFLIIGIDEKNGRITNSPFKQSGLNDVTELYNLVVKSVDLPIEFEFREVKVSSSISQDIFSVIVIPPSLAKPHVIGRYITRKGGEIQNYIPIRKSTGVFPANRSDIEFMYYDRKNIDPEYALEIKTYKARSGFSTFEFGIQFDVQLCFHSFGRKPIAIADSKLTIHPTAENKLNQDLEFSLYTYRDSTSNTSPYYTLATKFLVVPSNHVQTAFVNYRFSCKQLKVNEIAENLRSSDQTSFTIKVSDVNGKIYSSGILEATKHKV